MSKTVASGEQDCSLRAHTLFTEGNTLAQQFQTNGRIGDIYIAETLIREAVDLTPADDTSLPWRLTILGVVLKIRYEYKGDRADIDAAIASQERARALSQNPMEVVDILINMANSYTMRDAPGDADKAIGMLREAARIAPEGSPRLPSILGNMARSLAGRFIDTDERRYIDEAVESVRRGLKLLQKDDQGRIYLLNTLGGALGGRFSRYGDMADVEEAIPALREAVELTPPTHTLLPHLLDTLAKNLNKRYEATQNISDIQESILLTQRAIESCPGDHFTQLAMLFNSLGSSLANRFHRLGNPADIEDSTIALRRAVDMTKRNPRAREDSDPSITYLNNLANSLSLRYMVNGRAQQDLTSAIDCYRQIISSAPAQSLHHARASLNLGMALISQYSDYDDKKAIQEAVSILRQASESASFDRPLRGSILYQLSISLWLLFQAERDPENLDAAISTFEHSLSLVGAQGTLKTDIQSDLGRAYFEKFQLEVDERHLESAREYLKHAAMAPLQRPRRRVRDALSLAEVCEMLDDTEGTLEAYGIAVDVGTKVAELGRRRQNQHADEMARDGCLNGASYAIEMGKVDLALRWLENGRCLMWREVEEFRAPVDDLRDKNPLLAEQFVRASANMDEAGGVGVAKMGSWCLSERSLAEEDGLRYAKAAQERDRILFQIRSIGGFEDFLRPPPLPQVLQNLPQDGPTIVINMSGRRSDAIILSPGQNWTPNVVTLPEFSLRFAAFLYDEMVECLRSHGARELLPGGQRGEEDTRGLKRVVGTTKAEGMGNVLKQLWVRVAKPIVEHLQLSVRFPSSNDEPPALTMILNVSLRKTLSRRRAFTGVSLDPSPFSLSMRPAYTTRRLARGRCSWTMPYLHTHQLSPRSLTGLAPPLWALPTDSLRAAVSFWLASPTPQDGLPCLVSAPKLKPFKRL